MSKTLNALSIKLKWQLHEHINKMHSIEQQISILEQKINSTLQKISNSCTIPASIVPEQEMARSHFMTQQHHHQDELMNHKNTLQLDWVELKKKQTSLNTTLKRLEKHQEARLKSQQYQLQKKTQNDSDEWTLQRQD